MGWFDEQIRLRKLNDEELLEESFLDMAGAVMGVEMQASLESNRIRTKNAIDAVLQCMHIRSRDIPEDITDLNDQLDYLLEPHGIMRRRVYLPSGWYKDAAGPMILIYKDGNIPVAVLPGKINGYEFTDPVTNKKCRVDAKTEKLFEEDGLCFYKPFPQKKLGIKDLLVYMALSRTVSDNTMIILSTAAITAVGALTPMLTKLAYGRVLRSGEMNILYALAFFMISVEIGHLLFDAVGNMITRQVQTKQAVAIEAAVMMRVLSLPASFFRKFSAGELYTRTQSISELCKQLASAVLSTGFTSLFSLVYIVQIFHYTPALVVPALCITLATVVFSVVSTLLNTEIARSSMKLAAEESGMNYAMITGIQKIKLAGAEKRAFAYDHQDEFRDQYGDRPDRHGGHVQRRDQERRDIRQLCGVYQLLWLCFRRLYGSLFHSAHDRGFSSHAGDGESHSRGGTGVHGRQADRHKARRQYRDEPCLLPLYGYDA